jgi:hypothetical protein
MGGDLLHTMAVIGLSRVRTELFRFSARKWQTSRICWGSVFEFWTLILG